MGVAVKRRRYVYTLTRASEYNSTLYCAASRPCPLSQAFLNGAGEQNQGCWPSERGEIRWVVSGWARESHGWAGMDRLDP